MFEQTVYIQLYTYTANYPYTYAAIYLSVYLFIYLSVYLYTNSSISVCIYLASVCTYIKTSVHPQF